MTDIAAADTRSLSSYPLYDCRAIEVLGNATRALSVDAVLSLHYPMRSQDCIVS